MSIWGKFGAAVGGMLGALGDMFRPGTGIQSAEADVAFTIAVIALSAKMAKADGIVTPDEVAAFERLFRVVPSEAANVRRVFDLARGDTAGFETYARQIVRRFAANPGLLEDILDGLFEIAKADGVLHPGEAAFLERVAQIFGFSPGEFRRIRASHFAPEASDPYVILGVAYDADDEAIRRTYLRLVRENHPDSLIGRGVPAEFVRLATDKLSAINGAYERLRQERGWQA
ncbi:MAG: molecular chaperone DjiA [Alphaproteobacteria bacterium]|nr:molecular chaperone DjiA [Alphaproteobacteria bacterium]MBV9692589.1 molecular chaperone DjiA [Alphaproteobacteria bacterium]